MWCVRYDNPGERAGPSAAAPEEAPASTSSEEGSDAGAVEGTPLAELLACSVPDLDAGASDKTRDLLHLLKQLEALNRCVHAQSCLPCHAAVPAHPGRPLCSGSRNGRAALQRPRNERGAWLFACTLAWRAVPHQRPYEGVNCLFCRACILNYALQITCL